MFRYKFQNLTFLLAVVLVLGGWLWSFLALRDLTQGIVTGFNSDVLINQIGSITDFSAIGFFGLLMVFFNFLISTELESRDSRFARGVALATVLLGVLIFIYFSAIIGVN
jgi:hypothetical protein